MIEFIGVAYLLLPILGGSIIHGIIAKFNWFKRLYRPIDFGLKWREKPVFGKNKTYRGLLLVGLGSSIFYMIQAKLLHGIPAIQQIELLDYTMSPAWLIGFLLGLGSILGELPNSFLKRQLNIQSGQTTTGTLKVLFYVFDQIDILLGFWVVAFILMPVSFTQVVYSVLIVFFIHILTTGIGYKLGMRKSER